MRHAVFVTVSPLTESVCLSISVHFQKVIHRDVKPSNLLLTDDGHIKVWYVLSGIVLLASSVARVGGLCIWVTCMWSDKTECYCDQNNLHKLRRIGLNKEAVAC